jgi:putative SOS response-associated peptidase YedK
MLDLPAVYPDTDDNGARNLTMMRWGFPPPPKGGPRPVTNVRNTKVPTGATTESNALVRPIHAKAMPVMLCDPEARDVWLTGSVEEALEFQRPLSAERLEIVATNRRAEAVGQGA